MPAISHPAPPASPAASQPPAAKPRKKRKYTKKNFLEFLCTVPALLLIVLLNHYPLVELVRYSFTDWNMLKKNICAVRFDWLAVAKAGQILILWLVL